MTRLLMPMTKNNGKKKILPRQVCYSVNFTSAYSKEKSKVKKDTRYRTE